MVPAGVSIVNRGVRFPVAFVMSSLQRESGLPSDKTSNTPSIYFSSLKFSLSSGLRPGLMFGVPPNLKLPVVGSIECCFEIVNLFLLLFATSSLFGVKLLLSTQVDCKDRSVFLLLGITFAETGSICLLESSITFIY